MSVTGSGTLFYIMLSIIQIIIWSLVFYKMSEKNQIREQFRYYIILIIGVVVYIIFTAFNELSYVENGLVLMLISAVSTYSVLIEREYLSVVIGIMTMLTVLFIAMTASGYSANMTVAAIAASCVLALFLAMSLLISAVDRLFNIEYNVQEKAFLTGIIDWVIYEVAANTMIYYHNEEFELLCFILLLAAATIVSVSVSVYHFYENRLQAQIADISYEQNQNNVEVIKKLYADTSRMRHDVKNCLLVIDGYVKNRDYQSVTEYIEKYTQQQLTLGMTIFCDNQVINYIINNKFNVCAQQNIQTKCIVSGRIDGISDVDMSILLGNLLDNAIEATVMADYPSVSVEIYCNENEMIIIVDNTIKESVLQHNKSLKTIKKDKKNHGFGVISIKNIVSKNSGTIEYSEIKNIFRCKIIMKCKKGNI